MGYPKKDDEVLILNRFLKEDPSKGLSTVATCEDIAVMKEEAKNVYAVSYTHMMSEQVEKLASDINMIRNMYQFAAVNYIRKGIGYDEYIRNYIYEHKADKEELYNVLDELAHSCLLYTSRCV